MSAHRNEVHAPEQLVVELPEIGWAVRSHPGDGTVSVHPSGDCFQLLDDKGKVQWTLWRRR